MFFLFDYYYLSLQLMYMYMLYLMFIYNYMYIYNILCFLIIILFSIFISYFENDFFSSLILLIETLAFLVMVIFSFFNNSWMKVYKFNLKKSLFLLFSMLITYNFNNNFNYDLFLAITNKNSFLISDLNMLFVGSFYNSLLFFILLLYMLLIVGIFILFLMKTVSNSNKKHVFKMIKFQNNYKQSWSVNGIRYMK